MKDLIWKWWYADKINYGGKLKLMGRVECLDHETLEELCHQLHNHLKEVEAERFDLEMVVRRQYREVIQGGTRVMVLYTCMKQKKGLFVQKRSKCVYF